MSGCNRSGTRRIDQKRQYVSAGFLSAAIKQRSGNPPKFPAFLFAGLCLCGALASVAALASDVMTVRSVRPSAIVATVNHIAITEADVDQALANAGTTESGALRQSVKYRLIALELMRQAAHRLHRGDLVAANGHTTKKGRALAAIRKYLRDTVRPAPVSDVEVEARYRVLVNIANALALQDTNLDVFACATTARALDPVVKISPLALTSSLARDTCTRSRYFIAPGRGPGFVASRACIRQQLEAQRFDEAVRAFADKLMLGAEIESR